MKNNTSTPKKGNIKRAAGVIPGVLQGSKGGYVAAYDTARRGVSIMNRLNDVSRKDLIADNSTSLIIGVVVPTLTEPFFSEAFTAIEAAARDNNYSIMIGQSLEFEDRENSILEKMIKQGVAGIIISVSKFTTSFPFLSRLKKANIPVVFFDRIPSSKTIHYVASNLDPGMSEGIDLLIGKGHRSIALINGPDSLTATKERLEIYERVLRKNNLQLNTEYIVNTDLTPEGNFMAMERLLNLASPPSAIVVFNDYVLLDCRKAIISRSRKGSEFCFLSFSNSPMLSHSNAKPFASIEQYPSMQGKTAVTLLLNLLGGGFNSSLSSYSYQQVSVGSSVVVYDPA
jgi:DNA-binding LacI/PurR family transcriptional regulator